MTRIFTRRAVLAGAALLTGAVLTGCGSSDHNNTMPGMGNATTTPPASAAAAFADADVTFAQQMIPHHQQAVAMAAMADTRATDPDVKKLAAQIKAAQGPEITVLTGWLNSWGKPAPQASMGGHGMDMGGGAMPGMMSDADMAKLMAASGKAFDTEFLRLMIAHHQGAITMAQDEVTNGKNPDAVKLAQQIATSQQAEIDTMKSILARV